MNINLQTNSNPDNQLVENLEDANKVFLSFALKISPVNFHLLLADFLKGSDSVYYFSQPERNISFLAIEQLAKQTFDVFNFAQLNKEVEIIKGKMISNFSEFKEFDFPLFLTSAKFPVKKISNEWKDFGEIDLIIPKISLYRKSDSYFLIYNIFTESFSHDENFYETLELHAQKIYDLELQLKDNTDKKSSINHFEQSDDSENWSKKIEAALEKIKQSSIEKVVLSRRLLYDVQSEINWQNALKELDEKYPACTNFVIKSGHSIFFGSTPELLARFSGNDFYTEALAGSIMRGSNSNEDLLLENDLLNS